MKSGTIDGFQWFAAYKKGAERIYAFREKLNNINYFPVPDSDTGNNLTVTFNGPIGAIRPDSSFSKTAASVAEHILRSARGNSGLIMAQFFQGLSEKGAFLDRVTPEEFSRLVNEAVPFVYSAVEKPVEGTMITVIREWADALTHGAEHENDFKLLLQSALEYARKSLEKTKAMIRSIKGKSCVDAGALGFVCFLEGMALSFEEPADNEDFKAETLSRLLEAEYEGKEVRTEEIPYRYCTEVYFSSAQCAEDLHSLLRDKGDSLIIAGGKERYRAHIHTNEPHDVIAALYSAGTVFEHKVDDMRREADVNHKRLSSIALVTDSAADIPPELADLYQIHIIPLNILFRGVSFQDKVTLSPRQLYSLMRSPAELPSSSQPSVETIRNRLLFLARHYESVLAITVAEKLSGTYQAFLKAAREIEKETSVPVTVFDSRLNSGAQGLLVLYAAQEIEKGKSLSQIVETLPEARAKTKIFVAPDNLETMVRGGRISPVKGWIARLTRFKPLVSLGEEGEGIIAGTAFSRKGIEKRILSEARAASEKDGIGAYAVVHSGAPDKACKLGEKLEKQLGFPPLYIMEISSVVALNAGLNAVAFCYRAHE